MSTHRTPGGKRIRDDLSHLLVDARGTSAPEPFGALSMAALIADGTITRERCCDGKTRWSTYERALEIANEMSAKHGVSQYAYPCPFCSTFHLATEYPSSPAAQRETTDREGA